jgi:hypothetical protein
MRLQPRPLLGLAAVVGGKAEQMEIGKFLQNYVGVAGQ